MALHWFISHSAALPADRRVELIAVSLAQMTSALCLLLKLLHGVVGCEGWNGLEPAQCQDVIKIKAVNQD